jgi:hypothetical protein
MRLSMVGRQVRTTVWISFRLQQRAIARSVRDRWRSWTRLTPSCSEGDLPDVCWLLSPRHGGRRQGIRRQAERYSQHRLLQHTHPGAVGTMGRRHKNLLETKAHDRGTVLARLEHLADGAVKRLETTALDARLCRWRIAVDDAGCESSESAGDPRTAGARRWDGRDVSAAHSRPQSNPFRGHASPFQASQKVSRRRRRPAWLDEVRGHRGFAKVPRLNTCLRKIQRASVRRRVFAFGRSGRPRSRSVVLVGSYVRRCSTRGLARAVRPAGRQRPGRDGTPPHPEPGRSCPGADSCRALTGTHLRPAPFLQRWTSPCTRYRRRRVVLFAGGHRPLMEGTLWGSY